MRHYFNLGTLAISNGGSNSAALDLTKYKCLRGISIFGPAALTGTVSVAVSADLGVTYVTLQSGGSDVLVAADKCVVIDYMGFDSIRLESSAAEGAARTFTLLGVEDIG